MEKFKTHSWMGMMGGKILLFILDDFGFLDFVPYTCIFKRIGNNNNKLVGN